jgi:hypothetical protein
MWRRHSCRPRFARGSASYVRPAREVKELAAVGVFELDKTRLKTKRSIGLIESACFKSPKTRWKLRSDETARPYIGEYPALAAVSSNARVPMMAAFRLTPVRRPSLPKS